MSRRSGGARAPAVLALAAALLVCSGCSTDGPRLDRSEFPEIGLPSDVEGLDPAIRRGLDERRRTIDALWQQPEPSAKELAEAYAALGNWHHAYWHWEQAVACYQAAARLEPQESRWPYYEAHCQRERGDATLARQAFERSLALAPRLATRLWLAELELASGRLPEAEALAAGVLEADPRCQHARFLLGKVALTQGDHARAIVLLEAVRDELPDLREIQHPLGLAYRASGDRLRAEAAFERSRRDSDKNAVGGRPLPPCGDEPLSALAGIKQGARFDSEKGRRLFQEGRFKEAAQALRQALEEAPDRLEDRLNLALALYRDGDARAAIDACSEVLRRDPDHVEAYFGRGVIRMSQAELTEAEKDFSAALSRSPQHTKARFQLGTIRHLLGDHAGALEHFKPVVELDPKNLEARVAATLELTELGRYHEALGAADRAIEALPREPIALFLKARLLASIPDPALRDGARALGLARSSFATRLVLFQGETMAMIHAELGQFERAAAWQRACLAAAEGAGEVDAASWVRKRLDAYESSRPARVAWVDDERFMLLRVLPPPHPGTPPP